MKFKSILVYVRLFLRLSGGEVNWVYVPESGQLTDLRGWVGVMGFEGGGTGGRDLKPNISRGWHLWKCK